MWPSATYRAAMNSSPLPVARPWTPPDMDTDVESHMDKQSPWSSDQNAPSSSQSESSEVLGLGIQDERPYTPIRASSYSNAPRYPHTPDSARMGGVLARSQTFDNASPLPSMPWNGSALSSKSKTSPVQGALFSCLNNLEHLILTAQPNEAQMENLISQLENMTSCLSAPESQSKHTEEHLFSELENTPEYAENGATIEAQPINKAEAEAYVAEVGHFIESVKKHTKDMETRLDEVKTLNDINFEVIAELRKELLAQQQKKPEKVKRRVVVVQKPSPFWGALKDALDDVGEMLFGS
jgi:hypothetical protein